MSDPARSGRSWRSPRSMVWLAMGTLSVRSIAARLVIGATSLRSTIALTPPPFAPSPSQIRNSRFAWQRGHRLVFLPEAIVYHQRLTSATRYFRRNYNIGYWKMYLLRHYPGKAERDSHTPQLIKVQIVLPGAAVVGTLEMFRPSIGLLIAIGLWIACGLGMLPFLSKIAWRDPLVLQIAPLMIFIRTLALGLGLFSGAVRFYLFRSDRPPD